MYDTPRNLQFVEIYEQSWKMSKVCKDKDSIFLLALNVLNGKLKENDE